VAVTNYNGPSTYTLGTNRGSVAWQGAAAGTTRTLVVTGLTPGRSATVTVTVARAGYSNAVGTVSGTALRTMAAPRLTNVSRNASGTRVSAQISNFSDNNTYVCSAVRSTGGTAIGSCSVNRTTRVVTVRGLTIGVLVNLTVTASRTGYTTGVVTLRNI
jgi:hypothetical protein